MLSLFDNKYYKSIGKPQKLVVFIHGYNGSPEAIDYAVQGLRRKLRNAVIVVPRAPFVCEKNEDNLQWLSFYKEDPQVRFRNPEATVAEPQLSTVHIPSSEMGFIAAGILLDRIQRPNLPYRCCYIQTTPVWRASTHALPSSLV